MFRRAHQEPRPLCHRPPASVYRQQLESATRESSSFCTSFTRSLAIDFTRAFEAGRQPDFCCLSIRHPTVYLCPPLFPLTLCVHFAQSLCEPIESLVVSKSTAHSLHFFGSSTVGLSFPAVLLLSCSPLSAYRRFAGASSLARSKACAGTSCLLSLPRQIH